MKYTLHVVALAHTQTTKEFLPCAYTQKVIKFCRMMKSLGHRVLLYASEENEAPCDELITCVKKKYSPENYLQAPFDPTAPDWIEMNNKVIAEIRMRKQPRDFVCLSAGLCQKQIADAFPEMMSVEFGIGYGGVFSKYKVFESYAWMHTVYGAVHGAHAADGNFFDAVIPNYFDPREFSFSPKKKNYFLFIGRLIDRKGISIAVEVCKRLKKKLIIAGQGTLPDYGEYVGVVDAKKRSELMSKAQAVFVPTLYLEPFGGVSIEANLCGTPVITTDWGAFTENIVNGENGFRCRMLSEFVAAAKTCNATASWNYRAIRENAIAKFSLDAVKLQYQKYFDQLYTLWDQGWYQM